MNLPELQQQLFRYAQDLQELMQQQRILQHRNQVMMQALGRGDQADDLLPTLLSRHMGVYLVTDIRGVISFASPGAYQMLCQPGGALTGQPMSQLVASASHGTLQDLLAQWTQDPACQALAQRTLTFCDGMASNPSHRFNTWAIPVRKQERTEIFWLLTDRVEADATVNDLPALQWLPTFDGCEDGLLLVDLQGHILAVNPAFTRITGYSVAEVQGRNPSLLSAGLQDEVFYQALWKQLTTCGYWSGELFDRRKNGQVYFEWLTIRAIQNTDATTVAYIGAFADMSPRENDHKQLAQLAYYDALTGLPNRRLLDACLTQALAQATRNTSALAVLLLDLDRLWLVQEKLGREQMEQLVRAVSTQLQAAVRQGDVVARVSDDEFVILLPAVDGPGVAEDIANYILFLLEAPMHVGGQAVTLHANIGCARFPHDGTDAPTLLRCADAAMYAARQFDLRFCHFDNAQANRS